MWVLVFVHFRLLRYNFSVEIPGHLIKKKKKKGKIIGAICLAPSILARAGILKGKIATVFPSEANTLKNYSAICTRASVEQDGLIITADGPGSARKFGELLVKTIYK